MNLEDKARERILKLLALSTSENDNEALSAIRMANSMLKKASGSWRDFFGFNLMKSQPERKAPKKRQPKPRPSQGEEPVVAQATMIRIYKDLKASKFYLHAERAVVDFVIRTADTYNKQGHISQNEFEALAYVYEKYVGVL